MTGDWPHGDPREIARSIVADPRFHVAAQPTEPPSLLDVAWRWIVDFLRGLLHAVDRALGARTPFEYAIGVAVIVVALALLGFGVYVAVRSIARDTRRRSPNGTTVAAEGSPQRAAALRAAAFAAAAERRFRAATGLLFAAATRALDERGRLIYDAARTPGEYRRLVRDPRFDALASDAVLALFAQAEPPESLFARMNNSYDQFFGDGAAG